MNQTLDYYNAYAAQFCDATIAIDMQSLYQPFLRYLPQHAMLLDLGCGSGRDTLAFKKMGYVVEATDYSQALVENARVVTGLAVRLESFYNLSDQDKYEGIWACASLIHCERSQLVDVFTRILSALKNNGICYMSFKYGEQNRQEQGRNFTDLNEVQAQQLFQQFDQVLLLQQWITIDQRAEHTQEWLNIIIQKKHLPKAALSQETEMKQGKCNGF